ncbi:MAG: HAMP domain-containing protein, partial [Candidatus Aminicenantes bacterium]|nr:HAMP domain-containing protein [Candidatus Aminicenantes bacterium]
AAWITALLTVLVASVLFVIEKREVGTILDQTKDQALLTAEYLASLNLRSLTTWDTDAMQQTIDQEIERGLVYCVIFDRSGKPLAANASIQTHPEVYDRSGLADDVAEGEYAIQTRALRTEDGLQDVLEVERPVFAPGVATKWGSIKIGRSLEDMEREVRRTRLVLILIGVAGFLVGLAAATFLARRVTQPLQKLVAGTVRVSQGDFRHRIAIASRDEIGELARSFNEMSARLLEARERMEAVHRQLVQAEKLASIGRLAATIAHEIRNPLTSVKLNIQKIEESERLDPYEKEHVAIAQEGIGQIETFIKELLGFTRASALMRERFALETVLDESLKVLREPFQAKGVVLRKAVGRDLPPISVDGDKMRQVFLNVLRNALEAVEPGGEIRVALTRGRLDGRPCLLARVGDDGCGIPEKDWDNIFEPFFSTKSTGFGLGLANARKIVEQHGGVIKVVKKRGRGSCFQIALPCEEGS